MGIKVGELFVALGFQGDMAKINKFSINMENAKLKALGVAAAVTAATYTVIKFSDASVRYAVSLKNFAIQTGLSIQELEKWRFVAEQNDVSGQELINTIKGIQRAQAEIRLGGGNIKPWQLLGIDPNENPFEILKQLRVSIKNIEPALAASVLGQMGVGQNFLNILKSSNLEFNKLNEKFLLTKKETNDLLILNRAFKNVIFSLRGLRNRLVALSASPLVKIATAVKNVALFILDLAFKIKDLSDRFSFLKKVLAITAVVIAAYFFPITAAIIGVIAVIDDLYVFLQGGNSIIGKFLEVFDIKPLIAELKKLKPEFELLLNYIVNTMGPDIKEAIVEPLKLLVFIINSLLRALTGAVKLINILTGKQKLEFYNPYSAENIEETRRIQGFAPSPKNLDKGNTNTNNNNVIINVNGVQSPEATGNIILNKLQYEMNSAYFQTPNLGVA